MFSFIKSSTLNFMLSFINIALCFVLEAVGGYGALNAVIGVFCFLVAMAMRSEERRLKNVHLNDKEL